MRCSIPRQACSRRCFSRTRPRRPMICLLYTSISAASASVRLCSSSLLTLQLLISTVSGHDTVGVVAKVAGLCTDCLLYTSPLPLPKCRKLPALQPVSTSAAASTNAAHLFLCIISAHAPYSIVCLLYTSVAAFFTRLFYHRQKALSSTFYAFCGKNMTFPKGRPSGSSICPGIGAAHSGRMTRSHGLKCRLQLKSTKKP